MLKAPPRRNLPGSEENKIEKNRARFRTVRDQKKRPDQMCGVAGRYFGFRFHIESIREPDRHVLRSEVFLGIDFLFTAILFSAINAFVFFGYFPTILLE